MPVAIDAWTIHDWINALLPQAFAEAIHRGLRAAPFGGVELSQDVDDTHFGITFLRSYFAHTKGSVKA